MKVKLFKGTNQNMSYVIVKALFNKHQLKDINLLKIFSLNVSSKGHCLAFFLTAKSTEANMPLVNKF